MCVCVCVCIHRIVAILFDLSIRIHIALNYCNNVVDYDELRTGRRRIHPYYDVTVAGQRCYDQQLVFNRIDALHRHASDDAIRLSSGVILMTDRPIRRRTIERFDGIGFFRRFFRHRCAILRSSGVILPSQNDANEIQHYYSL